MGYSCRPDNVMLCLSALGSVLEDMGYAVHVGDAEAAAHAAYASMHNSEAAAKKRKTARRPDQAGRFLPTAARMLLCGRFLFWVAWLLTKSR
jgi:hypothetical protein